MLFLNEWLPWLITFLCSSGAAPGPGLFLTYWFVVFAAVVFPAYWLIRHPPTRLALLSLCCVVFHTHFAGPAGVLPILVLGVLTYLIGLSRNRWACLAGILRPQPRPGRAPA